MQDADKQAHSTTKDGAPNKKKPNKAPVSGGGATPQQAAGKKKPADVLADTKTQPFSAPPEVELPKDDAVAAVVFRAGADADRTELPPAEQAALPTSDSAPKQTNDGAREVEAGAHSREKAERKELKKTERAQRKMTAHKFSLNFFSAINKKLHLNITTKITLYFGIVYVLVGIMSILITLSVMTNSIDAAAVKDMENYVEVAKEVLVERGTDQLSGLQGALKAVDMDMAVVAKDGSTDVWSTDPDKVSELTDNSNFIKYTKVGKKVYLSRYFEISVGGVNRGYSFYVMQNLDPDYQRISSTKWTLIVSVILSLFVVVLIGGFASGSAVKPIKKMTESARQITTEALSKRLDTVDTQDELKELAEVINNMLDNLQQTVESQERFVSDASHEMRTPISVIKGYSEMLLRWGAKDEAILQESIDAIANESDNMKKLIDNLLFLSRTNRDVKSLKYQTFFINDLVDEIAKEANIVDKDHLIQCQRMEALEIDASRDMLKQLMRIILDNAQKYTPKGGLITFNCYRHEGNVDVVVTDQGIGIAPNDLPHIFDRFYRADKARTRDGGGSGLGMAIAKKIADAHHGEIIIESKMNEGTTVILSLPLKQLPQVGY